MLRTLGAVFTRAITLIVALAAPDLKRSMAKRAQSKSLNSNSWPATIFEGGFRARGSALIKKVAAAK
jgi:hypothetical protein